MRIYSEFKLVDFNEKMGLLACTQQETDEGLGQAVLGKPEKKLAEQDFEEPALFRGPFQLPRAVSEQRLSTKDQGTRTNRYSDADEHDYLFELNPSQETVNDKEVSPLPFDQLLAMENDEMTEACNVSTEASPFAATPTATSRKLLLSDTRAKHTHSQPRSLRAEGKAHIRSSNSFSELVRD